MSLLEVIGWGILLVALGEVALIVWAVRNKRK